jgi:hypothetical protein
MSLRKEPAVPELKETILNRMGIADAMAHRAKATAKRLHQAAAKHHDALNGELAGLAQQIEGAGIGNNPELEERYCRALVARSHMAQAHTMAHADSLRMPEVGGNLKKGQESFNFDEESHPREKKGDQREGYKPGEFVPKGAAGNLAPKEDWQKNGVRSGAFKAWFGDWERDPKSASKVVDTETGEPLETWQTRLEKTGGKVVSKPVYHGSGKGGFRSFELSKTEPNGLVGPGFYFTENEEVAKSYLGKEAPEKGLSRELTDEDMEHIRDWGGMHASLNGVQAMFLNMETKTRSEFATWLAHRDHLHAPLRRLGITVGLQGKDQVYSCYLNIRNPVDADETPSDDTLGKIWDGIPEGHSWKLAAAEDPHYDWRNHFVEDNRGLTLLSLMRKNDTGGGWETNNKVAIQRALAAMGHDGLTHIGGTYAGNGDTKHRVWVAWEPTQIKSSEDSDGTFDPNNSDIYKGRVSRAQAEAAGQAAFGFEEQDHPRAAEGTAGQYKPGEFVPKAEQQGAVEKPDHEKEAWELSRSDMKSSSDYDKSYMTNYVDEAGNKTASSRTTPAQDEETPLGTWRRDDYKGSHGTEVEQLRELDPNDLIPSEDTDAPKKADVARYTEWAKEGKKAPPIHVVETDSGKLKISNGHRRWLAAKAAGTKIRAWVSPAAVIPDMKDSEGKPMKTGLTHELAIHHAIEAGQRVPDEVLQDYPDLKEQHDQKRKETLREAGQKADEAGFPGLAEAHQEVAPKEDWQKNGTRAKSFKSWFGDWESDPEQASKVLDNDGQPAETYPVEQTKVKGKDGRPKVVYHGHAQFPFSAFDKALQDPDALFGPGFYFTEDESVAQSYRDKKDTGITRLSRPLTSEDLPKMLHFLEGKQDKEWAGFKQSYQWRIESATRKNNGAAELSEFLEGDQGSKLEHVLGSVGVKLEMPPGQVHSVYLNIRSPFEIDDTPDDATRNKLGESLRGMGIDPGTRLQPKEKGDGEDLFKAVSDLCLDAMFSKHAAAVGWKTPKAGAVEVLKNAGFDGITHVGGQRMGKGHLHKVWIAFDPHQIKSVENEGTFDPTNPDINKAVRRPFVPPDMPRWRGPKPSPDSYIPLNGVEDREKFGGMIQAMKRGDWSWNVPLVRCGDQLLTGSHRYAAAKVVGIPLEVVDVDDLFKEAGGLDFKTTWEAGADPWTAWLNNMDAALKCLPPDLLAKYGVDLG